MINPHTTGNMARRTNLHKKGSRIKVNAGVHKGKSGIIHKVNPIKHTVIFDNGDTGYVKQSYCTFVEADQDVMRDQDQGNTVPKTSRLSNPSKVS
jgi:hypothetical protein